MTGIHSRSQATLQTPTPPLGRGQRGKKEEREQDTDSPRKGQGAGQGERERENGTEWQDKGKDRKIRDGEQDRVQAKKARVAQQDTEMEGKKAHCAAE